MLMVAPEVQGIDLFKIAGRSISGWVPSLKTGTVVRQPFCSQLEERLLLWLEYHPQVKSYARGDIGQAFATAYRLPMPKPAPFAIGYTFEDKPHDYLPDVVGTLTNGKLFIAEAGMEDDKRSDRNVANTTWYSCMPGARRFPPLLTLPPLCTRCGRGAKSRRSARWQAALNKSFLRIWWKRRSGRLWETARRKATCWSIWSSSRWIAPCPWPYSHRMRRLWCLLLSQTRSCLNRTLRRQPPSHALRAGCFPVRRWMPPHCLRHNGSNFTGIYGPWSWCWAGQPKRASPQRRASPGRR